MNIPVRMSWWSYDPSHRLEVRNHTRDCDWRTLKEMQHVGQYFQDKSEEWPYASNDQWLYCGRYGVGLLTVEMDDGGVEYGVGCLYGWNTVLTCASILHQQ